MWRRRALVGCVAAGLCIAVATAWLAPPATPAESELHGVDHMHIRRTADGHLLDLRYRVVDPERAKAMLASETTAYLVHERSGRRLPVPSTPKAGPLRNHGTPRAGRSYFALFANPGGLVRRGDRVSVVLGDLTTHLTVE